MGWCLTSVGASFCRNLVHMEDALHLFVFMPCKFFLQIMWLNLPCQTMVSSGLMLMQCLMAGMDACLYRDERLKAILLHYSMSSIFWNSAWDLRLMVYSAMIFRVKWLAFSLSESATVKIFGERFSYSFL